MAAGDFSASQILDAQAKVQEYWRSPGPWNAEFSHPVDTVRALFSKQTASASEVQNGGRVIGQRVYWPKSGVDSITHNGTSAPSLDCTLENGTQLETDEKIYTDNVFVFSNVALTETDLRQKNMYSPEELIAQTLIKGMNDIRKKLNVLGINFLNANKQANLDSLVTSSDLGNGNWAVNADLATIEIPVDDARNEDAIVEWETVLRNNDFNGSYFIISGRKNWRLAFDTSMYKARNDDQRSIMATFGAYDMFWDVRDLDQTLTEFNSFAVDPNAYLFVNKSYSSLVPVQKSETLWEYYIEDPDLMIMENGVMRPVRYEVVMQRKCSTRNSDTSIALDHQFEIKYLGQKNVAPPGIDGQTGIQKLVAV